MSGVEGAGLALGAIPLAIMLYQKVERFVKEYRSADKRLLKVIRSIQVTDGVFSATVDSILVRAFDESFEHSAYMRVADNDIWKNPEALIWKNPEALSKLMGHLGGLHSLFVVSVEGVWHALRDIDGLLQDLISTEIGSTEPIIAESSTNDGSMNSGMDSQCLRRGLSGGKTQTTVPAKRMRDEMELPNTPLQQDTQKSLGKRQRLLSRKKKLKAFSQDTISNLESYRDELKEHQDNLTMIRDLAKERSKRVLGTITDPSKQIDTQTITMRHRQVQAASRELYSIVCQVLKVSCKCHTLSLCLDDITPVAGVAAAPINNEKFMARYWFLLTYHGTDGYHCTHNLPKCNHTIPYLVFVAFQQAIAARASSTEDSSSITSSRLASIFDELRIAQSIPFEHNFYHPSDAGTTESLLLTLKLSNVGPTTSTTSLSCPVALSELISSEPELDTLDCFELAHDLLQCMLSFYSSPWLRNWDLDTVKCGGKPTQSRKLWIPHVPIEFKENSGTTNSELLKLGLILLQLGEKSRLDNPGDKVVIQKSLIQLHQKMVSTYRRVVENCIRNGSDGTMDLMEGQKLSDFLKDIKCLKGLVEEFTPPPLGTDVVF